MNSVPRWDPKKARTNLRKHGVAFEEAPRCFQGFQGLFSINPFRIARVAESPCVFGKRCSLVNHIRECSVERQTLLADFLQVVRLSKRLLMPGQKDAQPGGNRRAVSRSEEHTSELQSRSDLVCR